MLENAETIQKAGTLHLPEDPNAQPSSRARSLPELSHITHELGHLLAKVMLFPETCRENKSLRIGYANDTPLEAARGVLQTMYPPSIDPDVLPPDQRGLIAIAGGCAAVGYKWQRDDVRHIPGHTELLNAAVMDGHTSTSDVIACKDRLHLIDPDDVLTIWWCGYMLASSDAMRETLTRVAVDVAHEEVFWFRVSWLEGVLELGRKALQLGRQPDALVS